MSSTLKSRAIQLVLTMILPGFLACPASLAQEAPPDAVLLRHASEIRALRTDTADKKLPVEIQGVVTHFEPRWNYSIFVQDESAGIFVHQEKIEVRTFALGDVVRVRGYTEGGQFAPQIAATEIEVLGRKPLPEPHIPTTRELLTGILDAQWIRLHGRVRAASYNPKSEDAELSIAGDTTRFTAVIHGAHREDAAGLVDSEVALTGVCVPDRNQLRQFQSVVVHLAGMESVRVLKAAPPDPFSLPVIAATEILQFRSLDDWGHRIHVRGVVTHGQPGRQIFIQDATSSLQVETSMTNVVRPGDIVDVLGFPATDSTGKSYLEDGAYRVIGRTTPPIPTRVVGGDLTSEGLHASLLSIRGRLLDGKRVGGLYNLVLQADGSLVRAFLEPNARSASLSITPDSEIEVSGICIGIKDASGAFAAQLIIRSEADIAVLREAAWWTPRRAIVLGLAALAALFLAVVIVAFLVRWNLALREQILERQRTERCLAKQRAEYETILDSVPALVLFKDDANRHLRINRVGAELFGRKREDIEGHLASELDPAQAERFWQDDLEVIQSGGPKLGIIENLTLPDGRVRRVSTDKIPYRDAAGNVTGVIVFAVDITERLEAQEGLQRAHDQLEVRVHRRTAELQAEVIQRRCAEEAASHARLDAEAANRAKSQFLAAMSHEIRTPMNAIIGMANLLLDTPLDDVQREFAQTVRNSGDGLLTIINDILDFSKIEAGKLQLEEIEFDLRESVEGVVEILAQAADSKGIELACLIESNVANDLIADPGRLRQVLLNLTANAVKFTSRGEVIVGVSQLEETNVSVELRFTVRDTGIGIPKEVQNALFRPFVQADSSTTRQFGGTGLGLAISHRLVELMGGRIGVTSTPGEGSTFWFTLPFLKNPKPAIPNPPPANLEGRRVLIVDDNATNYLILDHQLIAWRMRKGSHAATGDDALSLLRHAVRSGDPFDLALLDMDMPGMNGLELARAVRADPSLEGLGLVILTSLCHQVPIEQMQAAGISAYLVKPVKQAQLRTTLAKVLSRGQSRLAASPTKTAGENVPELLPGWTPEPAVESPHTALRILVAEDNAVNQMVTARQLAKLGYPAEVVGNGRQVLEALAAHPYNVILMDCHMPEMDGYEASRQVRDQGRTSNELVIIAMTANAMQGDREKCLAAGMDDYVSKPTRMEILRSALDRAAHRLNAQAAA